MKDLTETTKLCHIQGKQGKDYAGEKSDNGHGEGVEGVSHQLLRPPQMTPGPAIPGSHFQIASGNSSWALALRDVHWPLRGAKEQISCP